MFRLILVSILSIVTFGAPARAQDRSYEIEVQGQSETIQVWDAKGEPKGLILFGHGWGGRPASYERLFEGWAERGFAVEAPLNLDSGAHPRNASLPRDGMTSAVAIVGQRMLTMLSLREAAAARGLPVVLAGHSFGGYVAMSHGEGRWFQGELPGPAPAAVLALSSPGVVPPLVTDETYVGLAVPFMMVTGTQDATGSSMPTWEVHRFAFDRSRAGEKYLLVVEDGGHNLAALDDESLAAPLLAWTSDFLKAYATGDATARAALARNPESPRIRVERR